MAGEVKGFFKLHYHSAISVVSALDFVLVSVLIGTYS